MLGLEVRFNDREELAFMERHMGRSAVVGLVMSDNLDWFERLSIHPPWRGAMGEQHAALVWISWVAKVRWLTAYVMHEDTGWYDDKITLAVGHIAGVVNQRQSKTGHDAGIAAYTVPYRYCKSFGLSH